MLKYSILESLFFSHDKINIIGYSVYTISKKKISLKYKNAMDEKKNWRVEGDERETIVLTNMNETRRVH